MLILYTLYTFICICCSVRAARKEYLLYIANSFVCFSLPLPPKLRLTLRLPPILRLKRYYFKTLRFRTKKLPHFKPGSHQLK